MGNDIVEVIVGESKKTFKVHSGLLSGKSEFFRAAFEGKFREGQDQRIELPETSETTFRGLLLWCYTGQVLESSENPTDVPLRSLVSLYAFADFCGIPKLQDDTIDQIVNTLVAGRTMPPRIVYECTRTGSPLRRLFIHYFTKVYDWQKNAEKKATILSGFCTDSLFDMMTASCTAPSLTRHHARTGLANQKSDYHINPEQMNLPD